MKFNLLIILSILTISLISCGKDEMNISEKYSPVVMDRSLVPDSVNNVILRRDISNYLAECNYTLSGTVYYAEHNNTKYYFFETKNHIGNHSGISVYLIEDTTLIYMMEVVDTNFIVTDLQNINKVSSYKLNDNPSEEDYSRRKTCRESTNNWEDCMDCALDRLTDSWVGVLACAVNPVSCAGAALIHCASLAVKKPKDDE